MTFLELLQKLSEERKASPQSVSWFEIAEKLKITIESFRELAKSNLVGTELTEAAKAEANSRDLPPRAYQEMLIRAKSTQSDDLGALLKDVVGRYDRGVVTLPKLLEEKRVNELARQYSRYKNRVGAELLHLNPGEIDPDTGVKTATTFAHALFQNEAPRADVEDYFNKVIWAIGSKKELSESYMSLSDTSGESILELIKRKSLEAKYQGIYETLQQGRNMWGHNYLFPKQAAAVAVAVGVDTHTTSIHGSVDKSFVTLASNYAASLGIEDKVRRSSDRNIEVKRDAKWNHSIDRNLEELRDRIEGATKTDESLTAYIRPTLAAGEDLEKAKAKFKYQAETALRLLDGLDGLDQDVFGKTYTIRSNEPTSSGLTPREIVGIGYASLSDKERWTNPELDVQHFMSFVENMYVAKRGYNIDRFGDEEYLEHGGDADDNKCLGGSVNQIAMGLKDHKEVEVVVLDASTMKPGLMKNYLPGILKSFESKERELIRSWIGTGIISEELLTRVVVELKKTDLQKEFGEGDINRLASIIMRTLSQAELNGLKKAVGIETHVSIDSLERFVFDEENGYITSAEALYKKDPEKYSALLIKELRAGFVTGAEVSQGAIRSRQLMNLLLTSPNAEFVQETKEQFKAHFQTLTPESRDYQFILSIDSGNVGLVESMMDLVSANPIDRRPGHDGQTALHVAVQSDNVEMVEKLLAKMSPEAINFQDGNGQTALHIAVQSGNVEIVEKLLVKMSPEAIQSKVYELNALHFAATYGHGMVVEKLLAVMSPEAINAKNNNSETALHLAAQKNNAEVVEKLLAKMSPEAINDTANLGRTALHVAVQSDNVEMVEKLLAKMSPEAISCEDDNGRTALHLAATSGHGMVVEKLLAVMSPEAINAKNNNGETALHLAAHKNNSEVVEKLLAKMSPEAINDKAKFASTALHLAAVYGHGMVVDKLLAKMSPEAINFQNGNGKTALHLAVQSGNVEMVETFHRYQYEALRLAMTKKDEGIPRKLDKVLTLLTAMGDNMGVRSNKTGNTILNLAILTKQPDIAAMILNHPNCKHIDLENKNNSGKTAAELAESAGYRDLAKKIRSMIRKKQTWTDYAKSFLRKPGGDSRDR